ncbi:MAG: hypothetical protein AAGE96_18025 [Cyanobacteria bacterium P01_G01_bin.19]
MDNENKKVIARTHPENVEPGKGAPGNQVGVQMAQTTAVNPPDMTIPSGADPELSKEQIHNMESQEAVTGVSTTEGYVIDESGRMDNYAVEPEMYVEEK